MIVILLVLIIVTIFVIGRKLINKQDVEYNEPVSIKWHKPDGFMEHLLFLAHMGEAMSSYGDYQFVHLYVYIDEEKNSISIVFYGIDSVSIYKNTASWNYLVENSEDMISCEFVFAIEEEIPYYLKDYDTMLDHLRTVAPNAYYDQIRGISFNRHELSYADLPNNLDDTMMKCIK